MNMQIKIALSFGALILTACTHHRTAIEPNENFGAFNWDPGNRPVYTSEYTADSDNVAFIQYRAANGDRLGTSIVLDNIQWRASRNSNNFWELVSYSGFLAKSENNEGQHVSSISASVGGNMWRVKQYKSEAIPTDQYTIIWELNKIHVPHQSSSPRDTEDIWLHATSNFLITTNVQKYPTNLTRFKGQWESPEPGDLHVFARLELSPKGILVFYVDLIPGAGLSDFNVSYAELPSDSSERMKSRFYANQEKHLMKNP